MRVAVDEGKYVVVIEEDGGLRALRHGEEWRDLTGDNLVFNLAWELNEAREKIRSMEEDLENSGLGNTDSPTAT